MSTKKEVLILGYGEMGHAFQALLEPCHNVTIWNRSSVRGKIFVPLEQAAQKAEVIIFCLPVNAHDPVLKTLLPIIKDDTLYISIAKGLNESAQTAAEIFENKIKNYSLIYGPMISEEICNMKMGFAQFGCSHKEHYKIIEEIFEKTRLYLKSSNDITGISWSVIIKNVYALAFGMIDELDLGKNVQGFLTVTALEELDGIVKSLGGNAESSYGLSGLGDLITTGSSENSHHHTLGRKMARGDYSDLKGEGVHTLLMVEKFNRFEWRKYPLFVAIRHIVRQETNARESILSLFINKGDL